MDNSRKKYDRGIAFKILVATLFACLAISLSLYISKHTFSKILTTVDGLSQPNRKMQLVNNLFRGLARIDQLQRNESLRPEALCEALLKESGRFKSLLDTLRQIDITDEVQVRRIDSMEKLLNRRDLLYVRYFRLQASLIKNDTLAARVRALSEMLDKNTYFDSNVLKTRKTTHVVIDTLHQQEERPSLWKRIFARSRSKPGHVKKKIEESVEVRLDTTFGKNDSLTRMGRAVSEIASNRTRQRKVLVDRRSELNRANNILTDQLLRILNDIENGELANTAMQNATAYKVVDRGLAQIDLLLVAFIMGTLILVSLILTDIRRSNKYRRELVIAKEAAEEAALAKQRFLSNMSHELRTPLQTIIGIAEQVRTQPQPSPKSLDNIYQSSFHLLQIVNEVLDYSQLSSGKYTLRPVPFNMSGLLEEVREIISVQADRQGLTLICDVQTDKGQYYMGDPFRLKQILLNLLGNAVKFTDKGSVRLSVVDHFEGGRHTFEFTVEDTGPGISASDLETIFDPFEQGEGNARQQGTGLGLSIVKSLVELQQGSIEVKSEPGKGAQFSFRLPYPETAPAPEADNRSAATKKAFNGHAWLVDDDVFILQLCSSIFSKHGIRHTCFSSSVAALAATPPADLKVIFLDIRMTGMTGIELCSQLRQKQIPSRPLFVALTAQALPDEQEAILQQGFDKLLMKPFLEKDLVGALPKVEEKESIAEKPTHLPDLSAIRAMVGEDADLFQLTLKNFISETTHDLDAINTCFANNDAAGLSETFHRLAGRLGMVGMTNASVAMRKMEVDLRSGRYTPADVPVEELNKEINSILGTISDLQEV